METEEGGSTWDFIGSRTPSPLSSLESRPSSPIPIPLLASCVMEDARPSPPSSFKGSYGRTATFIVGSATDSTISSVSGRASPCIDTSVDNGADVSFIDTGVQTDPVPVDMKVICEENRAFLCYNRRLVKPTEAGHVTIDIGQLPYDEEKADGTCIDTRNTCWQDVFKRVTSGGYALCATVASLVGWAAMALIDDAENVAESARDALSSFVF